MINTAALLAFLAANWVPIVIALAGGYVVYQNRDAIKAKLGMKSAAEGDDAAPNGLEALIARFQNLPIVKQLEITADDIQRTGRSAVLIKVGDWVEEIEDPATKADCQAAYSKLFNAIVVTTGDAPAPTPAK
ncbi:MAG: hypothetical protein AB7G28_26360 [Pirellulales bacterium]